MIGASSFLMSEGGVVRVKGRVFGCELVFWTGLVLLDCRFVGRKDRSEPFQV